MLWKCEHTNVQSSDVQCEDPMNHCNWRNRVKLPLKQLKYTIFLAGFQIFFSSYQSLQYSCNVIHLGGGWFGLRLRTFLLKIFSFLVKLKVKNTFGTHAGVRVDVLLTTWKCVGQIWSMWGHFCFVRLANCL